MERIEKVEVVAQVNNFTQGAASKDQILNSLQDEKNRQPINIEDDFIQKLDSYSLEAIVELKISRFLEQLGSFYPEELYSMIMKKAEKPLISQILLRTGGNQVHASRILGINRNTLRKKIKLYGL